MFKKSERFSQRTFIFEANTIIIYQSRKNPVWGGDYRKYIRLYYTSFSSLFLLNFPIFQPYTISGYYKGLPAHHHQSYPGTYSASFSCFYPYTIESRPTTKRPHQSEYTMNNWRNIYLITVCTFNSSSKPFFSIHLYEMICVPAKPDTFSPASCYCPPSMRRDDCS